jgi:acyl-ACP thioesterase
MNDPSIHARSFVPRYSELGERGDVSPPALLNILEDASFTHCDEAGWGVFRLVSAGFGWVLLRGGLEMRRYPTYREAFTVETWFSEFRRFYGSREYRIKSSSGESLGWGRSLWIFYSLERRRPVPILDEIVKAWAPDGTYAGPMDLGEIEFPCPDPSAGTSFDVRRSDIDTNGHVNNVNYLAWALEATPPEATEGRFLASIRGQFRREVTYGSTIKAAVAGHDASGAMTHGVFASGPEGGYLAAAARTRWLPAARS